MAYEYILLWSVLCYVVGAFPTGYLIARVSGIPDITACGSGTMGATNVARTIGVPFFFLVLCIDAGKAALVMSYSPYELIAVAPLLLMIGNVVSIFMQFGGGKGVASLVGILFVLSKPLLFFFVFIWLAVLCLYRSVGRASAIGLLCVALGTWWIVSTVLLCTTIFFSALLALCKHKRYLCLDL